MSPHTAAPAAARAPRSVEETGLPFLFLSELIAKVLYRRGQLRLPELAAHLKLGAAVIDPLIAFLRAEKLCEIARTGASGTDADLSYTLTEAGRARAATALARNAYAGPAPVTLAAYNEQVRAQSVAGMQVTREAMAAAFAAVQPGGSRRFFLHLHVLQRPSPASPPIRTCWPSSARP